MKNLTDSGPKAVSPSQDKATESLINMMKNTKISQQNSSNNGSFSKDDDGEHTESLNGDTNSMDPAVSDNKGPVVHNTTATVGDNQEVIMQKQQTGSHVDTESAPVNKEQQVKGSSPNDMVNNIDEMTAERGIPDARLDATHKNRQISDTDSDIPSPTSATVTVGTGEDMSDVKEEQELISNDIDDMTEKFSKGINLATTGTEDSEKKPDKIEHVEMKDSNKLPEAVKIPSSENDVNDDKTAEEATRVTLGSRSPPPGAIVTKRESDDQPPSELRGALPPLNTRSPIGAVSTQYEQGSWGDCTSNVYEPQQPFSWGVNITPQETVSQIVPADFRMLPSCKYPNADRCQAAGMKHGRDGDSTNMPIKYMAPNNQQALKHQYLSLQKPKIPVENDDLSDLPPQQTQYPSTSASAMSGGLTTEQEVLEEVNRLNLALANPPGVTTSSYGLPPAVSTGSSGLPVGITTSSSGVPPGVTTCSSGLRYPNAPNIDARHMRQGLVTQSPSASSTSISSRRILKPNRTQSQLPVQQQETSKVQQQQMPYPQCQDAGLHQTVMSQSHRGQPMQPLQHLMSSHQWVMSPQQQAMSPQQQAMSPQQQVILPQQQAMSPQQQAMSPQQQAISPQQQAMSPQQQAMSPQQQGMLPQQQQRLLHQQAMSPISQAMSPTQQSMSPQQPAMSPQQQVMSPQQQVMSPQQQAMSPQQQAMSPQSMSPQNMPGSQSAPPPLSHPSVSYMNQTLLPNADLLPHTCNPVELTVPSPTPSTDTLTHAGLSVEDIDSLVDTGFSSGSSGVFSPQSVLTDDSILSVYTDLTAADQTAPDSDSYNNIPSPPDGCMEALDRFDDILNNKTGHKRSPLISCSEELEDLNQVIEEDWKRIGQVPTTAESLLRVPQTKNINVTKVSEAPLQDKIQEIIAKQPRILPNMPNMHKNDTYFVQNPAAPPTVYHPVSAVPVFTPELPVQRVPADKNDEQADQALSYVSTIPTKDLSSVDEDKDNLIHIISEAHQFYILKALLARMSREGILEKFINETNGDSRTPLYTALTSLPDKGQPNLQQSMVRELVDHGADVNVQCCHGRMNSGLETIYQTPLHLAASLCRADILEILLQAKGAKVNMQNTAQDTPLHCAVRKHGIKYEGKERDGRNAIKVLVSHQADVGAKAKAGKTIVHMIAENKWDEKLLSFVLQQIPPARLSDIINAKDDGGNTALHLLLGWSLRLNGARTKGMMLSMLKILMHHGADPKVRDSRNRTPQQFAGGDKELVDLLTKKNSRENSRSQRNSSSRSSPEMAPPVVTPILPQVALQSVPLVPTTIPMYNYPLPTQMQQNTFR